MALKFWYKLPQYSTLEPPKFSSGWLNVFKARYNVKRRKKHGQAAEVDQIQMELDLTQRTRNWSRYGRSTYSTSYLDSWGAQGPNNFAVIYGAAKGGLQQLNTSTLDVREGYKGQTAVKYVPSFPWTLLHRQIDLTVWKLLTRISRIFFHFWLILRILISRFYCMQYSASRYRRGLGAFFSDCFGPISHQKWSWQTGCGVLGMACPRNSRLIFHTTSFTISLLT